MLCQHRSRARFVFRDPAPYQNAADPVIIDQDYSVVAKYGADPSETERDLQIWAHGQCALLAQRMHELSGWPILKLGVDHFIVQRPDGALVDAYGVHHPMNDEDTSHFDKIAIVTRQVTLVGKGEIAIPSLNDRERGPRPY